MRFVLAASLLAGLVSPSFADDAMKKKEAPKKEEPKKEEAKQEEPAKCLVVKAGEKDVAPGAEVDYMAKYKAKAPITPVVAKTFCKSESRAVAQKWIKDNGVCSGKKSAWKYTVTFGQPGKEEKFDLNVTCPK